MEEYLLTVPRRIFGSGQGGRPSRTRDSNQNGAKRPIPVRFVSHGGAEGERSLRQPFLSLIFRHFFMRMVRHFRRTFPLFQKDTPDERCRHSRPILQVHPRRPGTAGERAPGLPPALGDRLEPDSLVPLPTESMGEALSPSFMDLAFSARLKASGTFHIHLVMEHIYGPSPGCKRVVPVRRKVVAYIYPASSWKRCVSGPR